MEIEDSEDTEAQPSSVTAAVSVMTETTSETTELPPESNEDVKMTRIKVSESADNANICSTISRSSEVPPSVTNTTCLHRDSAGNDVKAEIISNTLKIATPSSIVGTYQNAATSDSAVTSSTNSMTAISKCPARSPNSTSDTTKSTAPNSRLKTSTSSCTTATPTAPKSRETTPSAAATTTAWTAANRDSSTTSKIVKNSNSETASQTIAVSQTMAPSVKCEKTEASAKTAKKSVGPNANVTPKSTPAAPHSTALVSVRSEDKNPPKEPSHTSESKTKPSKSTPKVGKYCY